MSSLQLSVLQSIWINQSLTSTLNITSLLTRSVNFRQLTGSVTLTFLHYSFILGECCGLSYNNSIKNYTYLLYLLQNMYELDILYLLLPSKVAILTKNFQISKVHLENTIVHQPIVPFAKNVQSILFQILR